MPEQKPVEAIATLLLAGAAFLYFTGRLDGVIAGFHRMGTPSNPQVEDAALATLHRYTTEYSGADNDIIRARLTAQRNATLCAVLPRKVEGWIGRLTNLSLIGTGEAMLTVDLDGKVSVRTWNDMVSDAFDHSTVPPNTPLASKLETMRTGSIVSFSGQFISDSKSCIHEMSITTAGGMDSPELLFRFTDVQSVE